jgi:biopolymer transport protein ExbB/TolQ
LLVAVPAVWAYNHFANEVAAYDVEISNTWTDFKDYFINRRRKRETSS